MTEWMLLFRQIAFQQSKCAEKSPVVEGYAALLISFALAAAYADCSTMTELSAARFERACGHAFIEIISG